MFAETRRKRTELLSLLTGAIGLVFTGSKVYEGRKADPSAGSFYLKIEVN
jgi:hypothetical protein